MLFVYVEAQLTETCAGSVLGSFHRGSILFLIKWHSVAGGLAGTQLPGKPKNAGLHLVTNSFCLRRLVLQSAPQYYCCYCVCVSLWNGATVEGVRYGGSSHSFSVVDVYAKHLVFSARCLSVRSPVLAAHLKTCRTTSHRVLPLSHSRSSSLGVNGGNRGAINVHI